MSYSNDWSDTVPVDHTKFKSVPGTVRTLRIDIEDRLKNLFYGWVAGEVQTDEGVKTLPYRDQGADPGASANKIKAYGKKVGGKTEFFLQDEDGNVLQMTTGGKINGAILGGTLPSAIFLQIYSVGDIFISTSPTNPSTKFGGTWVAWGTGQVPVGVDAGQTEFNTVEKSGGEKTHLNLSTESGVPAHNHPTTAGQNGGGGNAGSQRWASGISQYGDDTGNNTPQNAAVAHNNLQPYITCYMWKRTV